MEFHNQLTLLPDIILFHGSTVLVGLGFLLVEVSRSNSDTLHSVGLSWTGDQLDAETST